MRWTSIPLVAIGASSLSKRAGEFLFTGVNVAGGEFGNMNLPGQLNRDYVWPAASAIDTLIATGMNTFRIALMMERTVPEKLTGTINETYFVGFETAVKYVTDKGAYAVIDPHNFGRYYGEIITDVAGFKAWWQTVASRFKDNERVIFDTNNEYHDMENQLVADLNQAAIDGIRGVGATSQYIFIEGNAWSGAWHWVDSGTGAALVNLRDPSDLLIYEMHQYLDADGSGTHDACVSPTVGAERVASATQWLRQNKKRGIIGETAGADNAVCIAAIRGELQHLLDNSDVWAGWLWWAAGPWWGEYMFNMEPPEGIAYQNILPQIEEFVGA